MCAEISSSLMDGVGMKGIFKWSPEKTDIELLNKGVMMKKIALLVFSFLVFVAGMASAAEQVSGCVKCHTDEAMLKSLFLPPKIAAGGGEG
jgi:hypothetical protein